MLKEFVEKWKQKLAKEIDTFDRLPWLTTIQLEGDKVAEHFLDVIKKFSGQVGIVLENIYYREDTPSSELVKIVRDCESDGLVFLSKFPEHFKTGLIYLNLKDSKDINNYKQYSSKYVHCVSRGVFKYLEEINFKFDGSNAVIIGRSDDIESPITQKLLDNGCTVTTCHSKTSPGFIRFILRDADLVIVVEGEPEIIGKNMAHKALIIDVSMNLDEEGNFIESVSNP